MLRLYFGMTHMHIKKEPEEPPLLRPFRPPVQNLSPETLRFPPATSRVSCLPSLQTPGNGTSGEATQQLSTMLTESAFPQIQFFATGQAIPEASLGVFNARPYTPACGRPQKTGVNYNDSRVGVFTPFE